MRAGPPSALLSCAEREGGILLRRKAPDQATCEFYLNKFTALNAVAGQKIADIPRHTWAMCATRGNVVWDQVTSNISETTNHMITAYVSQHVGMCVWDSIGALGS